MKQTVTFLSGVIALLCLAFPQAEAQWTQMDGPYGGSIFCITAAPNGTGGTKTTVPAGPQ